MTADITEVDPKFLVSYSDWIEHNNQIAKNHSSIPVIGDSVSVVRAPSAISNVTTLFKGLIDMPIVLSTDEKSTFSTKTKILENGLDSLYAEDWSECYLHSIVHCLLISYDAPFEELESAMSNTSEGNEDVLSQFDMKASSFIRIRYAERDLPRKARNEKPVITVPMT